jgi:fructokinase
VSDTIGAGDAFTAALVVGLLDGHSLDDINRRANEVAALVCSRPGGMSNSADERENSSVIPSEAHR